MSKSNRQMFFINKNPTGKIDAMWMGVAGIADGLVRIGTLGWVCTRFQVTVAGNQMKSYFLKQKTLRAQAARTEEREA